MSYYAPPRRPVRRRKDYTPMIVAMLAVIGIPALSYAVYKFVIDKPAPVAQQEPEPVESPNRFIRAQADKAKQYDPSPSPEAVAAAQAALSGGAFDPSSIPPVQNVESSQFDFGAAGVSFAPATYGGGGGGANLINVSTAVSKVADKIKESTDAYPTLAIWLVDRTPSCEARRQEVARQLDSIYPTLVGTVDASAKPEDAKLLSVVGSFAADVQYATPEPTADAAAVRTALANIQTDQGKVENTFKAVETAVAQNLSYADPPHLRKLFVVVVTDEVGDDQADRDRVAELLQKYAIPLYVIGQSASFGSLGSKDAGPEGAGGQITGPESHDVEWISLDFPGGMSIGGPAGQDCGIGPYALSYLCRKSGGEYFASGSYGMSVGLPPQYQPKYLSEAEYQAQVGSNKALGALFAAAQLKHAQQISGPRVSFGVDENGQAVGREVDDAQKPVALIVPQIVALNDTLKKGESDRGKLTEPRQQAAFDLAYGRSLAARARAEGYIALLAAFKAGKKLSSGQAGTWTLVPAHGIEKNSVLTGMADKAKQYLEGVIANHPGTPWAQAAQQELSMPMGWAWQE